VWRVRIDDSCIPAPGAVWTVTLPDGVRSVTYVHAEDPEARWRAAGEVSGDPELVAAVLATMEGETEHIWHYGGVVELLGWTYMHATGLWETTPAVRWDPGDDSTPVDMALCLVDVTPRWSVVNPALDQFLIGIIFDAERLERLESLTSCEQEWPPQP
jgi:hypothetical protein